jgi:hypothetical protein
VECERRLGIDNSIALEGKRKPEMVEWHPTTTTRKNICTQTD